MENDHRNYSWSFSMKVWDRDGIKSSDRWLAVSHASAANTLLTDYAPGTTTDHLTLVVNWTQNYIDSLKLNTTLVKL